MPARLGPAPHGFQNVGDTSGRLLVVTTPTAVERFFEQCAELPPGPPDMKALAAVMDANWAEFAGPRSGSPTRSRPAGRS